MADVISGLKDEDIATEWRHERASATADDDGTDWRRAADDADGMDPTEGPDDSDSDRRTAERRTERHQHSADRARHPEACNDAPRALRRCDDLDVPDHFGVAPHRWRHPAGFDDVLSVADVDRALTVTGLRRPAFRLVQDGEAIAPRRYTRHARQRQHRHRRPDRPRRVMDLFADGATIVLQGLQRWWSRPPASAATWSSPSATRCRPTPT